jgi:hypothetical protein
MNKPMTPSTETETTTANQIDKAVATVRAMLEKHAPEFKKEAVQKALGARELAADLFAVFRSHVERFSNMFVRIVKVDRSRTPEQALTATGRKQHVNSSVVATMPNGNGEEVKVVFFAPDKSAYNENGWISDDDLEKQYALRCLKPADPFSLAAVNEADPVFADEHPNATHWKDADGKWCYAAFHRWLGVGRGVRVRRLDDDWHAFWLFAGLESSTKV